MRSEDSGDASKLCVSRRYNYQRGPSVYMLSADKGNDYGRNMYSFLYISLEKTRLPVLSDPR